MAKMDRNPLVDGARGNVSKKYVYKTRGNGTFLDLMPRINKKLAVTERQENVRDLFSEASLYAKGAMSSPTLKKEYKAKAKPGSTAFNVAFRDYLKAPKVKSINTEQYNGTPGSIIVVRAKDDFKVVEVKVSIFDADSKLIEEGNAILNPNNHNNWIYTTTQTNADTDRCIVKAVALDLPGNKGSLEVNI